jgi:hypothetical protein
MGGACSAYGRDEKCILGRETGREGTHLEDTGVILKSNVKINVTDTDLDREDWIRLAQDRDKWWACVDTVMNLPVP